MVECELVIWQVPQLQNRMNTNICIPLPVLYLLSTGGISWYL